MNALISIVTEDSNFFKQIVQMIPMELRKEGIEQLSPGESLKNTQMIITDKITDDIMKQGIPVFLFADNMPEGILESVSFHFYKKNSFQVAVFQKDIMEWSEIAFALDNAAEKARQSHAKKEKYKALVADYKMSLELANRMQHDAMEPKNIKGFEQEYYYQPACMVSGDFLITEEVDGKIFILIGDVTNHGYNTGLYGASIVGSIRGFLNTAPRYALNLTGLVDYMRYSWKYYNDKTDPCLATILFCMIDKENKSIEFINCGHEAPILVHEKKASILNVYENPELPPMGPGIEQTPIPKVFSFLPGDSLFIYTDGITEVFKDPAKKNWEDAYSEERILASIQHEVSKEDWIPSKVINGVRKDADSYSVTEDFENQNLLDSTLDGAVDDVTMYMIKWLE